MKWPGICPAIFCCRSLRRRFTQSVFRKFTRSVFCLVRKADCKPLIVEVDHVPQAGRRSVVEIGRARREPAQDRSFEPADILAFAGDHGAARVGDLVDFAGERAVLELACDREHRAAPKYRALGACCRRHRARRYPSGALTEWWPTFGASWQVPQNPEMWSTVELIVEAGNARDVDLGSC